MRIYVFKSATMGDDEFVDLVTMLEAAGFEVVVIEAFADQAIGADVMFSPEDALIFLMTQGCDSDSQLLGLSERVSRAGGRVVGVWPKGATGEAFASAAEWHGSAAVGWDEKRVKAAIAGEDAWETPTGSKRPAPHTERHKC